MEAAERTGRPAALGHPGFPPTSPFACGPASQQESEQQRRRQQQQQQQTAGEQEAVEQANLDPELTLPSDAKIARWFRTGRALSRITARDSDSSEQHPHVALHVQVAPRAGVCAVSNTHAYPACTPADSALPSFQK